MGALKAALVFGVCAVAGSGCADWHYGDSGLPRENAQAIVVPAPRLERAPSPQPGDVQFAQINPVLRAVEETLLKEDDFYRTARLSYDEQYSSFAIGQLKYDAEFETRSTSWSPGEAFHGASSTWYKARRSATEQVQGIQTGTDISVSTNVFELLRYSGARGLKEAQKSANYEFRDRVIGLLTRLSTVDTMLELSRILRDSRDLSVDVAGKELKKSRDRQACYERGECQAHPLEGETQQQAQSEAIARRKREVSNVKLGIDELRKARIDLSSEGVLVGHPGTQDFTGVRAPTTLGLRETLLEIKGTSLKAGIRGYFALSAADYAKLTDKMKRNFLKIQNAEGLARADLEKSYRQTLKDFRKGIAESKR